MTTRFAPCYDCARYRPEDRKTETCDAFPDGIPEEIVQGKNRHRQPVEGDHGLQWTPLSEPKVSTSSRAGRRA